jgi:glycosyltransferase involved in cell wall biosynthesis
MKIRTGYRIALVTGGLNLGGSTTFLLNLGGELHRRGVPFSIYSFDNHNPLNRDFDFLSIPVALENSNKCIFEDRISSILNKIQGFQPTHVIACLGPDSFEILRYIPNGILRWGMIQSDDPRVYATVSRYAPCLDKVVCVSKQIEKNCSIHPPFSAISTICLPYGVPCPETLPERSPRSTYELETSLPQIRVLYLGRLEQEQKRVRLFPEIYKRLIENGTNFSWTIAGSGPERNYLEQELHSGLGHEIYFTGTIAYKNIYSTLATHDVLLLASDFEGLPLSLLEAMGHGLVPVVSNLPSGIPEVVDSQSGVLVDPSDTEGYADGISRLARDPALLSSLSASARARVVKDFSVTAMTDRWLAALESQNAYPPCWPKSIPILPPLTATTAFRYVPLLRPIRRLFKKLSK